MAQWYKIHLPTKRHGFDPWVKKIPWRRKWQPTAVFLPGKSHGQRNLEATVHGAAKSWIQLSNSTTTTNTTWYLSFFFPTTEHLKIVNKYVQFLSSSKIFHLQNAPWQCKLTHSPSPRLHLTRDPHYEPCDLAWDLAQPGHWGTTEIDIAMSKAEATTQVFYLQFQLFKIGKLWEYLFKT